MLVYAVDQPLMFLDSVYTYLICHNKTADTGIYQRLISSVYPPLFLAMHHWLVDLTFPSIYYTSFQGDFLSDDPTNCVKALKEGG